MATSGGPRIETDGLVLKLDAANIKSYTGSSTWFDLSGNENHSSILIGTYSSSNDGYLDSVGNSPGRLEIFTPHSTSLLNTFNVLSGGWSIEEWILIRDTTYPETSAGSVVSDNAYSSGAIGFDWNHGQGSLSQFQMGASWNVGQPSGYDVRGFINLDTQFRSYNTWYLRHIFWDRNSAKMGVYYNGILQGQIDISVLNGLPLADSGSIYWGQLYGWMHDGSRAGMKVYNRILTSLEVQQNYNATKSRFGL